MLGAVESGVDFEKRIATIYQQCRTPQQIEFQFDQLRSELQSEITDTQNAAREKLLDNFDQEVVEKVRLESRAALDRFNARLWELTRHLLANYADFDDASYSFTLRDNPFNDETIYPGPYRLGREVEDANTYRIGHPLAQRLLERAKTQPLPDAKLTFRLSDAGKRITILDPLRGASGWLTLRRLTVSALETEDELILAGVDDAGELLDAEQCRRLFDLRAFVSDGAQSLPPPALQTAFERTRAEVLDAMTQRSGVWFDDEMEKLERWADDRRTTLHSALDEAEEALRTGRRAARVAPTLPEKLDAQRQIRKLEAKRDEAWRDYDRAGRDLDARKETLLDDVASRLQRHAEEHEIFTVRWRIA